MTIRPLSPTRDPAEDMLAAFDELGHDACSLLRLFQPFVPISSSGLKSTGIAHNSIHEEMEPGSEWDREDKRSRLIFLNDFLETGERTERGPDGIGSKIRDGTFAGHGEKSVDLIKGFVVFSDHDIDQGEILFSLLQAIAQGKRKLSEIVNATGISQPTANKHLGVLSDLDIVEREVPVIEDKPMKSKKGLYRIKTSFSNSGFASFFPEDRSSKWTMKTESLSLSGRKSRIIFRLSVKKSLATSS